ncbi:MAG: DUF1640 domain-containing protein [Bacteroidetes bacterium]|nr:DUF1640 domain-containing protein [Bacteroidota bacterium]
MINTLAIAHKLSGSGFDDQQAEALTNVFADVAERQQQDLATKDFVTSQIQTVRGEISELRGDMNTMESNLRGDMNTMESNLRGEIGELRGDMNTKISSLEARLVRWMLVTFFSGLGILFAALRLFPS